MRQCKHTTLCSKPAKQKPSAGSVGMLGSAAALQAAQHPGNGEWPSAHIWQWQHADAADSHPGLDVCSGCGPNPCCAPTKHLHTRCNCAVSCAVCCHLCRQVCLHERDVASYTAYTRGAVGQAILMAGPLGAPCSRHDIQGRLVSRPHRHGASQRRVVGVPHRVGRQALDSLPNSACSERGKCWCENRHSCQLQLQQDTHHCI